MKLKQQKLKLIIEKIKQVMYLDSGCPILYDKLTGYHNLWSEGFITPTNGYASKFKLDRNNVSSVREIAEKIMR